MKFTFLGTGTSQGVPVIACHCVVCQSTNKKDKRTRSSLLVQSDKTTIVIDTGPDFRYQILREKIEDLDAIVYTHGHKDHVAGLDDIRPFNYMLGKTIGVYAEQHVQDVLKREFSYVFAENKYPGVPQITLNTINETPFLINDFKLIPIRAMHKDLPVLGFRMGDFTYITDANFISVSEFEKIKGTEVLVLNALRREKHYSHFSLSEAITLAQTINAKQTYFTHISHHLGLYENINQELPDGIKLAYDGLTVEL